MRGWGSICGIAALALSLAAGSAAFAAQRPVYKLGSATCDGYPRLPIGMARGMCAGLVVGPPSGVFKERTLRLPRTLVALPGGSDWIVADLGAWVAGAGSVWRLSAAPGAPPKLVRLLSGLSMPHGLGFGPDGRLYVGEMSRIIAFDAAAPDPGATVEVVVGGLPDNRLHEDRHPLSQFIFEQDGSLIVSVGAPSDQCADQPASPAPARCLESEGAEPAAGLRRYAYLGDGRFSADFTVLAQGLRNSLALVRHPSGTLLQAENSYDFDDAAEPYEEINRIEPGRHYGWPYCFDMDQPTPAWAGRGAMSCRGPEYTRPAALIAPHAAPVAMLYYDGAMFPALSGRLVMSWHGYRSTGARLVAFDVDANGVPVTRTGARYPSYTPRGVRWLAFRRGPAAQPAVLTPGWREAEGLRPTGAPVGLAVAADGSIWVADDRNGTILRLSIDRP